MLYPMFSIAIHLYGSYNILFFQILSSSDNSDETNWVIVEAACLNITEFDFWNLIKVFLWYISGATIIGFWLYEFSFTKE